MTEINSFPINALTFEELETITDAQATDSDGVLFFDESVGVMKRMTRGELFKGKVIPIDSVEELAGIDTTGFSERQQFNMGSFAPDGESGGGAMLWEPDLPKSLHDGAQYFSPTVPAPADFNNPTDVQNYKDGVGEEWPAGFGIFVLDYAVSRSELEAVQAEIDDIQDEIDVIDLKDINIVSDITPLSLPVGFRLTTKGCLSIGDGGHGTFIVTDVEPPIVDGYSGILMANGNWAVLQPVNGVVAPAQFGCFDSIANCSTNFQLLVNYCIARSLAISGSGDLYVENILVTDDLAIFSNKKLNLMLPVGSEQRRVIFHSGGTIALSNVVLDSDNGTVGGYTLLSEGVGVLLRKSQFKNAKTISGYGEGVLINSSSGKSVIFDCDFYDNGAAGLSVAESAEIHIIDSRGYGNGQQGFYLNNYDLTFTKKISNVFIRGCHSYSNTGSGFALGNIYDNHDPDSDDFGHANQTCNNVQMSDCHAYDNGNYGFGLSAYKGGFVNLHSRNNSFGGMLINGRYLDFSNPQVYSNGDYGIDVGFGRNINITGGTVAFNATAGSNGGLLIEAALNINVTGTKVYGNGSSGSPNIVVAGLGGTGDGRYFPVKCSSVTLACEVDCADGRRGLLIKDNPDNIIDKNNYIGSNALLYTRYAIAPGSINTKGAVGSRSYYSATSSSGIIVGPDIPVNVLTNEATTFSGIRPYSYDFYRGKVAYCSVTSGGSGHVVGVTTATISGDGTGATATPIINDGVLIGVRIDNPGSGYTSATVTIGGAGTGTATATVGVALHGGLTWTVAFNQITDITTAASPGITYPSVPATINAPAAGSITLTERYGQWLLTAKNF